MSWEQPDLAAVRRRYRWVAPFYPFFNLVFVLPRGIRRRAVDRLDLRPGSRVLEVGCGTGANLPLLSRAVGEGGRVVGLDAAEPMLARARARCARKGLANCELRMGDAATDPLPGGLDGVLFSLSYSVIPESRRALAHAWQALREGGRVVILDAGVPQGRERSLGARYAAAASRASVLGDPFRAPWDDLRALGASPQVEREQRGYYYIVWAERGKEVPGGPGPP